MSWALLLLLICDMESSGGINVPSRGPCRGPYQISAGAVRDINERLGTNYRWPQDVEKHESAAQIAALYMDLWRTLATDDRSAETAARIFRAGPSGRHSDKADRYVAGLRHHMRRRGLDPRLLSEDLEGSPWLAKGKQ